MKEVELEIEATARLIGSWERHESIPDIYSFRDLARLYGVTMEELIGDKQPEVEEDNRYLDYLEITEEIRISRACVHKWHRDAKGEIRSKFCKEKGRMV